MSTIPPPVHMVRNERLELSKDIKTFNTSDDHEIDIEADQITLGDEGEGPVAIPRADELASEHL